MIESCKNSIKFVFDSKDNCLDSITKLMNMTTSHYTIGREHIQSTWPRPFLQLPPLAKGTKADQDHCTSRIMVELIKVMQEEGWLASSSILMVEAGRALWPHLHLAKRLKKSWCWKKVSVVQKVAVCSVSSWSHLMTLGSFSRHIISAMLSRSSSTTIRARVEGGRGKLSRQLPCVRWEMSCTQSWVRIVASL